MKNSRDDIQISLAKKAASSFWLKLRGLYCASTVKPRLIMSGWIDRLKHWAKQTKRDVYARMVCRT